MKATIFSNRLSRYLLAAMLLLPLGGILFVGCEKEKVIVEVPGPPPPPPPDDSDRPDEAEDLIAWYNPFQNVFLIDPAYTEVVLATLQAQSSFNGSYQFSGVNLLGEPRLIQFRIEPVKIPDIYHTATSVELALGPDFEGTTTVNGTTYKVYKNAKCGEVEKGFESACENNTGGTSAKRVWYDVRRCKRGNDFCYEALSIIGRQVNFHNADCQGSIKSEQSQPGYVCGQ